MSIHTQLKVKCLKCGLHFIICTERLEEWAKDFSKIYCPECGEQGKKLIYAESSDDFIFNVVPGKAEIVGYTG